MQVILTIIYIITIAVAIFFWYEYEQAQERIYSLESRLYDMKDCKKSGQLVLIKDYYDDYKKGENPYTVLAKIGNALIKKEELDSDQTY